MRRTFKTARRVCLVAAALVAAGCTSAAGPRLTLTRAGPVDTTSTAGPAQKFITAEGSARSASGDAVHSASLLMLISGMSLARANCLDFFTSMGREQRDLIVSRQIVNAVGALSTTLMLIENVDPDSIALVELGQGAANTGLDIYTENYLFAAENVESVRGLVFDAMDVHAQGALDLQPFDYSKAADLVIEHQNLCQPRPIADLVQRAIRAGKVTVDPVMGGGGSLGARLDLAAGRRLAELFEQPGTLAPDQIGALWWLLMDYSTPTTRKGTITTLLGPLAPAVLTDGTVTLGAARQAEVRQALMMFSPEAQAALATTASTGQRAADAAERAAAGPGTVPLAVQPPELQRFMSLLTSEQRRQLRELGGIEGLEDLALIERGVVPPETVVVPMPPPPSFVLPVHGGSNARSVPLRVN